MLDGSITMSLYATYCPPALGGKIHQSRIQHRRLYKCLAMQLSCVLVQTDENGHLPEPNKSFPSSEMAPRRCHLLSQENTVGIIGGTSVFSTLVFLEKLIFWSTRNGGECPPFVVCNDPSLNKHLPSHNPYNSFGSKRGQSFQFNHAAIVDNLQHRRAILEQSGARYIVMPCHLSHSWYGQISAGCSLPFLHVGDCVAKELQEAKLKPLETGNSVRIGVLGTIATLEAGFYQEKLQNQGFEVELPDKATMDHIVIPAVEALKRKDMEGARNLLRIAIQLLLVRAVNTIILASDEMQGILPYDDPLIKACIDPMDALARSTIRLSQQTSGNTRQKT